MDKRLTNLKDILDLIHNIDELTKWAEHNDLLQHPLICERLNTLENIKQIANLIQEPDILIQWAIENTILHNEVVLKRLEHLLTCEGCKRKFDTSMDLKEHNCCIQTMYVAPSSSLTCSWCGEVQKSTKQLQDHEEFHRLIDECTDNELCEINRQELPTITIDNKGYSNHLIKTSHNTSHKNNDTIQNENTPSDLKLSVPRSIMQSGAGEEDLDNILPYTFRQIGQKTFAKNLATESTYKVKFKEGWKENKMKNLMKGVRTMFDDILSKVKSNDGDLGRLIMTHPSLNHPIVVPLAPWKDINTKTVLDKIENVLNSDENIPLDQNFFITVGSIDIPKGSGKRYHITKLTGENNSITNKQSIFTIEEVENNLCLPTAIGRTFLKMCTVVSLEEWHRITKNDHPDMNVNMKMFVHRVVTQSHLRHLNKITKNPYRKSMALTLCQEANVPTDRPLNLTDIKAFEDYLDVNILVISSKMGNKFCRVANNTKRKNLFLYLVQTEDNEVGHFHGIASITGFFNYSYFCEACLKPYKNKGTHACQTACDVCGSNECSIGKDVMSCLHCARTCRNRRCFVRHKARKDKKGRDVDKSMCELNYQCKRCRKVLHWKERDPSRHRCAEYKCKNCHQYYLGRHLCYQRVRENPPKTTPRKFFFYDFETSQVDRVVDCEKGYKPPSQPCDQCVTTTTDQRCNKCRVCINCHQSWCGSFEHHVNYCVLQSTCEKCGADNDEDLLNEFSKCSVCGSRCDKCAVFKENAFIPPCSDTCGFRQRVFRGDNTPVDFCSHIMSRYYRNSVFIAHNAKGFDSYPVLNAMIDKHGIRPNKIIYDGSKIMYMHVAHGLGLTFIDSLNFMAMKLSDIPKCFGLEELQKGYFPHLFNSSQNWHYVGPYPHPKYYMVEYMSAKEKDAFMKWYSGKKEEVFDFQKEMYSYCVSDVDILRRGCMSFRKIMMNVTSTTTTSGSVIRGIDPFDYVTIASACQGIFRRLFMKEVYETQVTHKETGISMTCASKYEKGQLMIQLSNDDDNTSWKTKEDMTDDYRIGETGFVKSDIALVPSEGYATDTFSKSSIQWLEWQVEKARRDGRPSPKKIVHGLNGRERKIGPYRLDGYDEETNTAYEFLGCVYHGCPTCYPNDRTKTKHPVTQHTMNQLHYLTKKREAYLKKIGLNYISIWEHEFTSQMRENMEMKEYVDTLELTDRLHPRDSFFGGRTNAIKLFHQIKEEDETIEYYDFTSLYPYINKYARYPVGHPTIITSNFKNMTEYFGLAKVKVLPPKQLFHPVLPYLSNGKLKFPLCQHCADHESQHECGCTDDDRSLIGTWCTPELNVALSKGYTLLKIYEVYHFEETTKYDSDTGKGGLFSEYVNLFLKLKQEASGFPSECVTEDQKLEYIADYLAKEGIQLSYDDIKTNPGLRSLAKICLNSFWGKYGQRLNMKQSSFLYDREPDKFFQLLSDVRKDVQNFHIISPSIMQLEYKDASSFLPMDFKTNIFIATFTTCWARLKLYETLDLIGTRCLYFDTDSVIFVDRCKTITNQLPIGNYLGELKNEISPSDQYITHFVSSGPKSYAYKTRSNKEVCKVRGFCLKNVSNSELINFSTMKDIVFDKSVESVKIVNPRKISRLPMKRKLYNRKEEKEFTMVYTKRRLLNDLTTLPFGYCS